MKNDYKQTNNLKQTIQNLTNLVTHHKHIHKNKRKKEKENKQIFFFSAK